MSTSESIESAAVTPESLREALTAGDGGRGVDLIWDKFLDISFPEGYFLGAEKYELIPADVYECLWIPSDMPNRTESPDGRP